MIARFSSATSSIPLRARFLLCFACFFFCRFFWFLNRLACASGLSSCIAMTWCLGLAFLANARGGIICGGELAMGGESNEALSVVVGIVLACRECL